MLMLFGFKKGRCAAPHTHRLLNLSSKGKYKKDTEHLAEKTLINVIHENQEFHQKYPFRSFMKLQGKNNNTALVLLGSTVRAPWQSREDYDSSLPAKHNLMD